MISVQVANEQTRLPVDEDRLRRAVQAVLQGEAIAQAQVSLAVVDDAAIQRLNRRFLNRDQPTDVLSFVLEKWEHGLEGEVVASAQTAEQTAARFGWTPADELLLYVVHGTLHLVGYDDQTAAQRAEMRAKERAYLARFGLSPRYEESGCRGEGLRGAPAARPSSRETEVP